MKLNKKGYTVPELLILLGLVTLVSLVVIVKTSYAFKEIDNTKEIEKQDKKIVEKIAQLYSKKIEDRIKEEKVVYLTGEDLIKDNFLYDDNENKTIKFKFSYDEENDKISYEVIY